MAAASEIRPATRSDSGEPEKEAEDDRKAEAAEAAHKTADHAPGLEATLDQDIWARDHGHTYDAVEPTNLAKACRRRSGVALRGTSIGF